MIWAHIELHFLWLKSLVAKILMAKMYLCGGCYVGWRLVSGRSDRVANHSGYITSYAANVVNN